MAAFDRGANVVRIQNGSAVVFSEERGPVEERRQFGWADLARGCA